MVGPIIGAALAAVAAVLALIGQVMQKGKESEAASREAPVGELSLSVRVVLSAAGRTKRAPHAAA